ncbi:MAG: hypothetical protein OHK0039_45760 [Bacteroidia bacterium]
MNSYTATELRNRYRAAVQDAQAARAFGEHMDAYTGDGALHLGYKAAARALVARYEWIPLVKLSYVQAAMQLFREAVRRDPTQFEVRFLRFSIQHYLPAFLGQSGDLHDDKAFLLKHIGEHSRWDLTAAEAREMAGFLIESKRLSATELQLLRQTLHV